MATVKKIISWSLAIGFCLMVAIVLLILFYVGGDSRQNLEQLHRSKIQEEVLAKINDYKAKNGKNPYTLSEIGLEQTVCAYTRDDMVFYMIPDSPYYILECWDKNNKECFFMGKTNTIPYNNLW